VPRPTAFGETDARAICAHVRVAAAIMKFH
jgi:hypothetical protein